jgi:small subunit ribosomal protein S4
MVDVPSYHVQVGDDIAVRPASKDILPVQVSLEARTRPPLADWLVLDEKSRVGRVVRGPTRQDVKHPIQEQLIVELYSK